MRRLLSIDYQRRVTHVERAPIRSRPDCGTDMEEVSIGGPRVERVQYGKYCSKLGRISKVVATGLS